MKREPIHPGEILAEELAALGVRPAQLAEAIRVPKNRISQTINGKRAITADTALRLGKWFGTGPELWCNLQKIFELDRARDRLGSEIESLPTRDGVPSVGGPAE